MKSIYLIVGMKWRKTEHIVKKLDVGDPISLVRDGVLVDRVQVWAIGMCVGYIKAADVGVLTKSMDARGISQIEGRYAVTADRWPSVEVED